MERVALPSTLKLLGDSAFEECDRLRLVLFAKDTELDTVGCKCFRGSCIEEIALPRTQKVYYNAFQRCNRLRAIYVKDGCRASLFAAAIPVFAKVGPLPETAVCGAHV